MRANQLRLRFASMAYVLVCALRRIGLCHTDFAEATCGTIRLKFLKVGALVRLSVRRIKVAMASGCPIAATWGLAAAGSLRTPEPHPAEKAARRGALTSGIAFCPTGTPEKY
jgi:hypothetical protein